MKAKEADQKMDWTVRWLDSVAGGTNTMSQRKLTSIETRGVGLNAVKKLAKSKGVHLLLLNDDRGDDLIVASTKPFEVVC